jgi:Uma2 family endonuclease
MQALEKDTSVEVEVNFSPLLRRYTLEEFWALPEREDHARYNLIGGYLFMVPPPNPPHGDIASRMTRSLVKFLDTHNIEGDEHHPPEPIYIRAEGSTYLEPDMMYVSRELRDKMGTRCTSADIIFEFLSRSTSVYDRTTKADTYLALGVRELWLIDPFTETIEVRHASNVGERPVWEIFRYPRGYKAKSRVLDGYKVSVDDLFAGLLVATDDAD